MAFSKFMLTTGGMTLYAKAQQGKQLHFTRVALGDGLLGGGSMVNRSALISERMSLLIDAVQLVNDSTNAAVIATLSNVGLLDGFIAREAGVFAEDPDTHQEILYLYAHAGTEGEPIPDGNSGTLVYERLKIIITLENTGSVSFEASGNPLYLSAEDVEPIIQAYVGDLNELNTSQKSDVVGAVNEVKSGLDGLDAKVPTGTATALYVALPNVNSYRGGMKLTIIPIANNGGAATTLKINSLAAKPVYKANTTTAPTLKAGKPYTLILNADLSHFFLEASAEGDAVAANVLAGKTFSNDDDTGLTGTMVNRGSVGTVNLTTEGAEYTIPAGYHSGLGKVKAVISGLIASVIKAGTTVGGIVGTFTSDATAAAGDLLSGKKAYVNGNLVTGNIPVIGNAHITAPQRTAGALSGDTPGVNYAYVMPAKGYYDGVNSWARYPEPYLGAQYIKAGTTIMGVTGTLTPLDLLPGENVWASADNNSYVNSTSYTIKKEIVVGVSGTVRVKMRLFGGSSTTMYGQIRKNGVPVGTERTVSGYNSSGVIFAEDIPVTAGERIEFWCRTDNGYQGWYDQFRLCTLASYPSFNVSRNQ
jgi:hypothetical protein